MTQTSTETVEKVRADLEAREADKRERHRGGGARIPTRADREAARERHIAHTAEVIDRAAADAPIDVEGACVLCGQRRGLESERPVERRTKPTRIGWKGVLGIPVYGEACGKCAGPLMGTDLQDIVTTRLWEERRDLMERLGYRRNPGPAAVDAGANPEYDVVGDWRPACWAHLVYEAQRDGRKPPSKPKSPFSWLKVDDIDEGDSKR